MNKRGGTREDDERRERQTKRESDAVVVYSFDLVSLVLLLSSFSSLIQDCTLPTSKKKLKTSTNK
jgi:hypothetical protein